MDSSVSTSNIPLSTTALTSPAAAADEEGYAAAFKACKKYAKKVWKLDHMADAKAKRLLYATDKYKKASKEDQEAMEILAEHDNLTARYNAKISGKPTRMLTSCTNTDSVAVGYLISQLEELYTRKVGLPVIRQD
jgi:hypothetical protein